VVSPAVDSVAITTDLDQTLIFSPRATARLGGGLPCSPVEYIDGVVISEIAQAVSQRIDLLPPRVFLIPATTRTVDQLSRLQLPFAYRYAIAANGGVVLVDGVPDPSWDAEVQRRVTVVAPLDAAQALLTARADRPWLLRSYRAAELFCYAIVDPTELDAAELPELDEACAQIGWRALPQGRKLYLLPDGLAKEAAVTFVLERLCAQLGQRLRHFAAGDAEVDRAMLDIADIGWVPAGSPLAVAGDLPPQVRVTDTGGHSGAAQIAAEWFTECLAVDDGAD
jgi:hypothetical protein